MPTAANAQIGINAHQNHEDMPPSGLVMRVCDIERFLSEWSRRERSPQTLERYRFYLKKLYSFLPENHVIARDTAQRWCEQLLQEGYAPNTVNLCMSAYNTWLDYMGRRELQMPVKLEAKGKTRAALTREEYFRLLLAARAQGQERLFLIIKVFGSTGLYASELNDVTLESIREGHIISRGIGTREGKTMRKTFFPESLRKELMSYAEQEGIAAGPIFRAREGNPVNRSTVAVMIRRLGEEVGIPDGCATPTGLRLMYLANRAEVEADAARMVEQTLERQAAQEQLIVGWTD